MSNYLIKFDIFFSEDAYVFIRTNYETGKKILFCSCFTHYGEIIICIRMIVLGNINLVREEIA